jgi:pyruvate dehydrogenase (quinone)
MNGMNVLITVAKYWQKWADPRLVVLVLNNRDLNQVTWEQRVLAGDPKFLASQSLPDVRYHRYAELLGLNGIFVDDPERIGAAWDEAFAADRPTVVEFYTDPNVPPLPPHITLEQARAFVSSMFGEPELGSVLRNTAREIVSSLMPGSTTKSKEKAPDKS